MEFSKRQKILILFVSVAITAISFIVNYANSQSCTPFFCAGDAEFCFLKCYAHDGCDFAWLRGSWCINPGPNGECVSSWDVYCLDESYFRHYCFEFSGECYY